MKRVVCLVLMVAICLMMSACDPGMYYIDREALNAVVCVQLIEYDNPDQKQFVTWVPDQFDQLRPFDQSRTRVLETLPQEKMGEFLDTFSETDILYAYYAYDSPKDICLRLTYENGDFLIIWANYADDAFAGYIGEYASDGSVLTFWGCFSGVFYYKNLVNQVFSYPLT